MSFGQGGPQWDPWKPTSQQPQFSAQSDDTPDWAALAEASEARNKRRRLMLIGGGALATVAVGAAVAVAVVSANGKAEATDRPTGDASAGADIPSASAAEPSFAPTSAPPPLDPKDFITSARKDTAPISPESVFPGTRLTMGDTVYQKGATASTDDCASVAQGPMVQALTANGCTRVLRVTYSKDGVAVTVGVALFDSEAQATKARQAAGAEGSVITSLPGDGVPTFCRTAVCRTTTNSYGRYAYFTTAGFTDGKDVTQQSTEAFTIGDDLQEFTYRQIHRRGEAQASAAADR
ncbi:hypothetical protein GCM10010145_03770 [Streptomyces ruber]|uniref:Uncharacterized protein n=2 Tax=Streptomyces TaxID=1883 RepID=A0A918B8Y0_9ACTN|nr:hypothetical protein [Streptomyces ruber]GGQ39367.1 hypothetical protein GCM10010145_03770 [Streptomyces ruber]